MYLPAARPLLPPGARSDGIPGARGRTRMSECTEAAQDGDGSAAPAGTGGADRHLPPGRRFVELDDLFPEVSGWWRAAPVREI